MQRSAQAAPERSGVRRLQPPTSLAVLLGIVVIVSLAWALLIPPWQSPDSFAHYGYAESLAENHARPGQRGGEISSDAVAGMDAVGAGIGAFHPQTDPPNWSSVSFGRYLAQERAHPPSKTDGGGPNPAASYPPLYYLFAAGGYLLDSGGTAFGRLYAMQIEGVLLIMVTTVGAWLLAGEVFGRRRLSQLACAATAALLPMTTFMSTTVNPDALLIAAWTLALWLGARVVKRGARGWDPVALGAVTAVAFLTKTTAYALIPPVVFALLVGWLRRPAGERTPAFMRILAAGAVLGIPVIGWLALTHGASASAVEQVASTSTTHAQRFSIRQFLSYVWQFYLPRLPFLRPFRPTPGLPVYDIWLRQGLGTFGWLDVYLPTWVYKAAVVAFGGLGISSVAVLARRLTRRHLALLAFFALALLTLLGLLHLVEYLLLIGGSPGFNQGRYLLPVVGLLGLVVALVIGAVPPRARPAACGLLITALLALQAISFSAVLQAYYL